MVPSIPSMSRCGGQQRGLTPGIYCSPHAAERRFVHSCAGCVEESLVRVLVCGILAVEPFGRVDGAHGLGLGVLVEKIEGDIAVPPRRALMTIWISG